MERTTNCEPNEFRLVTTSRNRGFGESQDRQRRNWEQVAITLLVAAELILKARHLFVCWKIVVKNSVVYKGFVAWKFL